MRCIISCFYHTVLDEAYEYEDEAPPRTPVSKAAVPPPTYEDSEGPRSPPGPANSFLANMGGTVAHKIMQKYGFREGQGLGKQEAGPEHCAVRGEDQQEGRQDRCGRLDTGKKSDTNPLTEIFKCPTIVVLLRISGVIDEEAVRIFLEFERVESAIKGQRGCGQRRLSVERSCCHSWEIRRSNVSGGLSGECSRCLLSAVVDLNGRYFDGRVVKGCFYNLDKFRVLDLGEQVWQGPRFKTVRSNQALSGLSR
ncbi:hypothetical protein AAFF_G00200730 [Aldrovandia affinis]|uniref:G-patch domain-containing protein n=1 Tax=Aldrovandia affinis TaxID=143900 RepID=A0AAD7W5U4_9TELE|nr:hypothetical protein AAFF_G00200730 [Aldrovandia affinis]